MTVRALIPLFLFVVLVGSALAVTITFSDLNLQKNTKILIYDYSGNLVGEYNTTDTIELNGSSYIFVLKPSEASWFTDPWQTIEFLKASAPIMLSYALWFFLIIGILVVFLGVVTRIR